MADAVATTPAPPSSVFGRWWTQARTSLFWMVVVASGCALAGSSSAHTYKFKTLDDNFSFGWEMGRIGRVAGAGSGFQQSVQRHHGTDRMGAATLSISDRRSLQAVRDLHPRLGARAARPQQSLFCADLHSHFPDRQTMFQRKAGDLDCLAVGGDAARHVLVHALGVGDKSGGVAARADFLADARPGRTRRAQPLVRVRIAVGNRGAYQHFPAGVSAGFRIVGVVPALETRQAFAGGGCAGALVFVACIAPWVARNYRHFGTVNVSALKFRRRAAHRKRPVGRWNLERISPSHAECLRDAALPRRWARSLTLRSAQREAMAFIREDYCALHGS